MTHTPGPQHTSNGAGGHTMRVRPSVCLVSMPFYPVTSPGLGVSTLKATLREASVDADVYYGALDYFRFFASEHTAEQALFDYNFLASNGDLGDVFFAGALWGGSFDGVRDAMSRLVTSPNSMFSRALREQLFARFLHQAEQADAFLRFCLDRWDFGRYDIVGFSSTFCQNVASLALARLIRSRHPGVHLVFGGANCEGPMGQQLLRSFPWVDCVIQGEADFAFPEYVRRFSAGEDVSGVPGVVYRDGTGVRVGAPPQPLRDMDALPLPDFDDYCEQLPTALTCEENRHELQLPIETSRGCWWGAKSHCTFCGLNPTMMTYRAKSSERAIREFRRIHDYYEEHKVCAVDNILSMTYFTEVLPQLEDLGLTIFYETKANLTEEHVAQLARAGVRAMQPGIEGLNSEILALMKKGVKASQNVALLKWCQTYGVKPTWFYLYRFPYEREDCYWEAIPLFKRLAHLPPPRNPNPVVIDRYSPLFQFHKEFGLQDLRPTTRVDVYYRGLTAEERFNLAYHFEADYPQGPDAEYVLPLWQAVLEWQRRYAGGATFRAVEGDAVTLLMDTRGDTAAAYLLTGRGHLAHRLLRNACKEPVLARELFATTEPDSPTELSMADLALLLKAGELEAEEIKSPQGEADLGRFLRELDERSITVVLDGRHLGLAVDQAVRRASERPQGLTAVTAARST